MYDIDFDNPVWIHFIGIGGISMSGLVEIMRNRGFRVSGSVSNRSETTEHLESIGVDVRYGQRRENIVDGIDVVVYSAAIHEDNPEYAEAVSRGIPMMSRAELLGQIMKTYGTAIAIAGTHGKTTTTSMIAEILMREELDPTISVGGMLDTIGGNIRVGHSDVFLAEACEYTDSFLSFFPTVAVILNVKGDHFDYFKNIEAVRSSFRKFARLVPAYGLLVVSNDIEDLDELIDGLTCRVVTVGIEGEADIIARNIHYRTGAWPEFDCELPGGKTEHFALSVPGRHNVMNALAAIAVGEELGIPARKLAEDLEAYKGVHRRFELKGKIGGVTIIDDYAHHPDEIRATLETAAQSEAPRVVCVFQPHTYSRTKEFMDGFIDSLALADRVVLAKIYPARETDTLGVSSHDIEAGLAARGVDVHCFDTFDEIERFLLETSQSGDMLLTMGAGDIYKVGDELLGK